jgi:hypothetical protein
MVSVSFMSRPRRAAEFDRLSVHADTDIVSRGRAINDSFEAFRNPRECIYMGSVSHLSNLGQHSESTPIQT